MWKEWGKRLEPLLKISLQAKIKVGVLNIASSNNLFHIKLQEGNRF